MGWGPVDLVNKVLQEAKFKNKWILFFEFFSFERPILRYLWETLFVDQLNEFGTSLMDWGPVEWIRKVWQEATFKNKLILFFGYFWFFLILAANTEISVRNTFGTSWMGWGPVDWVRKVLQEAKLNGYCILIFFWATDTKISVKTLLGTS